MRDTSGSNWLAWRVKPTPAPTAPRADRFARPLLVADPAPPAAEVPGPDGIRHELVARVRAAIEAGTYDTEERWAVAEERLLRRIEGAV